MVQPCTFCMVSILFPSSFTSITRSSSKFVHSDFFCSEKKRVSYLHYNFKTNLIMSSQLNALHDSDSNATLRNIYLFELRSHTPIFLVHVHQPRMQIEMIRPGTFLMELLSNAMGPMNRIGQSTEFYSFKV